MKFHFKLDIIPVSASRPRVTRYGTFYSKKYDQFKKDVEPLIQQENLMILEGPLKLETIFYMPIPKSTSKKKTEEMEGQWHIKRPDSDNLQKAIKDSLEGYVYSDDAQVCYEIVKKVYSIKPGIEIKIEEIE